MSAHTLHYTLSLLIDILEYPLFCKRILQGTRILEFFVLRCCRSCHISSHHHLMRFKQKCFPAPLFCYFPSARHNPQFIWLFYICTTPSTVYLVILHLHDTIHSLFGYFTSARHHPQFIWLSYICTTPSTVYWVILHLHDAIHSLFLHSPVDASFLTAFKMFTFMTAVLHIIQFTLLRHYLPYPLND